MRPRSFNSGEIKRKYHMFLVWFVAAAVMLGMLPSRVVNAAEFDVDAGDVAGLIAAINTANGNGEADTINLAAGGTYTLTVADNGDNGLPVITSEITINGNGATIARSSAVGTPNFRIFRVAADGNLTLNDLTVENGFASLSNGGGISNDEGTLTITNSTLASNRADGSGGGIYNFDGILTITNSILADNDAGDNGGGIDNDLGTVTLTNSTLAGNGAGGDGGSIINIEATLTITNSTLSGNDADTNGGGISNVIAGTVTITNSTLAGNSASGASGGIYNEEGTVTITDSTLSGNSADGSAGILNQGTLTLTNSTLSGNVAQFNGGGIFNDTDGTATIINSTLAGNVADNGGGIVNLGTLTSTNSIVANSPSGGNCTNSGSFTATGSNVDTDGTCPGFAKVTTAQLNLGPLFFNGGPTQTHALLAGSVAINAGDQSECRTNNITTDQRGFLRDDGQCDIGAFEFGAGPRADLLVSLGVDKTSVKQGQLLTYTITVHNFGADTAQNVVVNDTLSTGTTFVSAAANKGNITTKPPVGQTGVVTWALGDLLDEEGGSATLVVKVLVKGKTTVTNTATVSSATVDPNPANNTAAITVSVAPGTTKK